MTMGREKRPIPLLKYSEMIDRLERKVVSGEQKDQLAILLSVCREAAYLYRQLQAHRDDPDKKDSFVTEMEHLQRIKNKLSEITQKRVIAGDDLNELFKLMRGYHEFDRIRIRGEKLRLARDISDYASIGAIILNGLMVGWQWTIQTLPAVLVMIGFYIPPIGYALSGLGAIIDFGYKAFQMYNILQSDDEDKDEVEESSKPAELIPTLIARMVARATETTLYTLVTLAFLGVMATVATAWILLAVAALVGWVNYDVIPTWRAWKEYQRNPTAENHNDFSQKRKKMLWGAVAVIGMALSACGPFGLGAVAVVGGVLFGIATTMQLYKLYKDYKAKKNKRRMVIEEVSVDEMNDNDPDVNLRLNFNTPNIQQRLTEEKQSLLTEELSETKVNPLDAVTIESPKGTLSGQSFMKPSTTALEEEVASTKNKKNYRKK